MFGTISKQNLDEEIIKYQELIAFGIKMGNYEKTHPLHELKELAIRFI